MKLDEEKLRSLFTNMAKLIKQSVKDLDPECGYIHEPEVVSTEVSKGNRVEVKERVGSIKVLGKKNKEDGGSSLLKKLIRKNV